MEKKYRVQTADYNVEVKANDLFYAGIKAFKKYPPEEVGTLTRIAEMPKSNNKWHYISSKVLLKKVEIIFGDLIIK